jgi:hypothetical protein
VPCAARRSRIRFSVLVASAVVSLPLLSVVSTAHADDEPPAETLVGELVQAWPEFENPADAVARADEGPLSWIEPAEGDAVRVPTEDVEALDPGATVEVTLGDEVVDAATREEGLEPAREVLATEVVTQPPVDPPVGEALPPGSVSNAVTVVMVVPAGGVRDSTTLGDVVAAVDGPVADFWWQESGGAVGVGVTAQHDWPATAYTASCSDATALWDEARARSEFVPGDGKHLLLYLPKTSTDCAYGLAEVGSAPSGGGRLMVRDTAPSVIAHELGHNFSLGHSSGKQCDRAVDVGRCRTVAYRDYYDVMGVSWSEVGSLNPPQAAWLGFLPDEQQQVVSHGSSATVSVPAYGARTAGRAVKLVAGDGDVYWLEYRAPVGQDAWLADGDRNWTRLQSGVLLRREPTPSDATYGYDGSLLLDGTPSGVSGWDGDLRVVLPVGPTVRVAGGDFLVTVTGADSTSASVSIDSAGIGPARLPIGSLDAVSLAGPSLSVRGWAVDLNSPARAVDVHVYVDGRAVVTRAGLSRPDVGRAYPTAGSRHGFAFTTRVAVGRHVVCAYAIDTSGPRSTPLGCRTVTYVPQRPVGTLDGVSLSGNRLSAHGWAVDPDTPTLGAQVHLYLDGRAVALTANRGRADVGRAFPAAGSAHGFSFATAVRAGSHRVCAYALDTSGRGSTDLGCRTVRYTPRLPMGALNRAVVSGGVLSVAGWVVDPDTPTTSARVHLYVDRNAVALPADRPRADVARAHPAAGSAHGFAYSTALTPGTHRVCAFGIDTAGQGSVQLGCRTVTG